MQMINRVAIVDDLKMIIERVKEKKVHHLNIDEATSFLELGLDSLELLEMRFDVERTWGVAVSDADAQNLKTVRDVVDAVVAHGALTP